MYTIELHTCLAVSLPAGAVSKSQARVSSRRHFIAALSRVSDFVGSEPHMGLLVPIIKV